MNVYRNINGEKGDLQTRPHPRATMCISYRNVLHATSGKSTRVLAPAEKKTRATPEVGRRPKQAFKGDHFKMLRLLAIVFYFLWFLHRYYHQHVILSFCKSRSEFAQGTAEFTRSQYLL